MNLAILKLQKEIKKALITQFDQLELNYKHFQNNPYDPDYIHRLRVELRKVRAVIHFLKPITDLKNYISINENLREIGKTLSDLRDIDALIENTRSIAIMEPDLTSDYATVFGYLDDERLKQAHLIANEEVISRFKTSLEQAKNKLLILPFSTDNIPDENFEVFIIKRYIKKGNKLNKQFKNVQLDNHHKVHELRKNAKKLRYTAVGFKVFLPKKIRKPHKQRAKKIQEQLGKATDIHVSIERLEQYKEKSRNEKLINAFQKIIDYQKENSPQRI